MAGSCSSLVPLNLFLILLCLYLGAATASGDTPVRIGGTFAHGLSHRPESTLSNFIGVPSASLKTNRHGATRPFLGRLTAAQPTGSSSSHLASSSASEALASRRALSYQQHGTNLLRRFLAETASAHWQAAATAATKPASYETGPANGMNAAVLDDSIEVDW